MSESDVSSSEAFQVLDELVKSGEVSEERAEFAREKFKALHAAFLQTVSNDQSLMAKAKQLNQQLQEEKARLDSSAGRTTEESSAVEMLREDSEQAEAEAALCRDREQNLQLEVNELQRQRNEYRAQLEEAEKEQAAALAPQIRQLREECAEYEEEVKRDRAKLEGIEKEATDLRSRVGEVQGVLGELASAKGTEEGNLQKVMQMPDKMKKQSDIVQNALKGLRVQESRLLDRIREHEIANNNLSMKLKELNDEHSRTAGTLERARLAMEQKERAVDEIRKDLEREGLEADLHLADQVKLDIEVKGMLADLKAEQDQLQRRLKEKETALKKLRRADLQLKQAQSVIPTQINVKEQVSHDKVLLELERKKNNKAIEELKKEVDIYMNNYLREEANGKEKSVLFQNSYAEVAELEQEVVALKKEEHTRERAIVELGSQRERMSRLAANKVNKWRETAEYVRVKELIIVDLKKKRKETVFRLRDFQQLYDLVKNQRNKFVNLIQASSQSIAEMKEKLKILGNEIEILRAESANKDKLLAKARMEHSSSQLERDHLRAELNKSALTFREKQDIVDEQISDVDKFNAIINSAEKDMLRLKKQYETQVEMRNWTGITLIDRNDELCILYEKANIQEEVLKQGEMELKHRDDEIRMLKLELKEVQRSMDVTRKLLPRIPALDADIASLQQQLLETRKRSEELSEALESPENKERWRRLEGKIPDKEELTAKINQLEERLNDKKEQLLEKELVLEEVSSLSDRLRAQAAEGRADTLELAKRVNDYQSRIRAITRRMMATVSELSMYQASAMKLQAEKTDLSSEVERAAELLAEGQPPTEDAEREWYRMQREKAALEELRQTKAQRAAEEDDKPATVTRTTAEPRPNAYIPADVGIPVPYGSMPFKPSEPGATMRHIVKPKEREIII
mmetsp:Transcript_19952/g.64959  ORF Transcript_19952/g.64959 Transcript_19952/m.64959 type:complete len:918 (-) Transcript_19952:40-2793(-)|eukprot:CAMPEP_0170134240 /NCGR_PEP_ID=MMETSP0033_2-20121228/1775_1 /TAXON_ID=195969 /ORGANISM="Dolichomastix tenuilepis, Strain CCMP3274" /LENGTH=917 /DNA_ID=CAMNT_0010369785 /DNA_START=24 /DNA_END=2777 /DNA_ORIENTATION=-